MSRQSALMVLLVVLTVGSVAGGVAGAPGPGETRSEQLGPADGTSRAPAVTQPAVADCQPAPPNRSESFVAACEQFRAANDSVHNASASLNETTAELENADAYTNETHSAAVADLRAIRASRDRLESAYDNLTDAVLTGEMAPAQQFVVLRSFERQYTETEAVAAASVERYNSTVATKRQGATSTVVQYLGVAGAVSLVIGAVLGAFVPMREARNVTEQMRLSSNVSYNRRAGLVPLAVGIALTLAGLGALWMLGAVGIIGVIV